MALMDLDCDAELSSDLLYNSDSFDCTIIKIHLTHEAGTELEIDTLSFTVYFGFASSIKIKRLTIMINCLELLKICPKGLEKTSTRLSIEEIQLLSL